LGKKLGDTLIGFWPQTSVPIFVKIG